VRHSRTLTIHGKRLKTDAPYNRLLNAEQLMQPDFEIADRTKVKLVTPSMSAIETALQVKRSLPPLSVATQTSIELHRSIQFQSINRHIIPRTNSSQRSNPALLFLLGRQILLKRCVAFLRLSFIATSNTRIKNARRIDLLVYPNNHNFFSQSNPNIT
jgi:hypothetical protein